MAKIAEDIHRSCCRPGSPAQHLVPGDLGREVRRSFSCRSQHAGQVDGESQRSSPRQAPTHLAAHLLSGGVRPETGAPAACGPSVMLRWIAGGLCHKLPTLSTKRGPAGKGGAS